MTADSVDLFDEAYLQRLRSGDDETARHFDRYFRHRLRPKVWDKFNRQRADDLVDDVMAAALQSILQGKPENADRLPAFIFGICVNLTKVAMRPKANREWAQAEFDHVPDSAQTTLEKLQAAETQQAVLEVLRTLRRRDRDVLVDLFYRGLSRTETAQKHGITRDQLRMILFQTRQKKSWVDFGSGSFPSE
jgi:RNA polymerase sigma factor (sigma-70 family)